MILILTKLLPKPPKKTEGLGKPQNPAEREKKMPKRKMRGAVVVAHADEWSSDGHYGMCGQSCPCCRFEVESQMSPDPATWLGVCDVCSSNARRAKRSRTC